MTVGHRQPRRLNLENRKRVARYGFGYLDHPVESANKYPHPGLTPALS
jgi:hypothetical protein